MTVIARDAVASDHLVYCWPFPIGPECEVTCGDEEQVVMCPAWTVGDRLGPGHHVWRTPDPTRAVGAFFVLTSAVEASFDLSTLFMIPQTGQPVRLRAVGSIQVRCADPGLLIAQFVGLPFDSVNDGVLRSVARSVERMLARLLTRRVVMAGTPLAVTDGGQLASIIEELIAYNPTAGAVFGIEMIRMGHLTIAADDGSSPVLQMPVVPDPSTVPAAPRGRARTHADPTMPPPVGTGASGVIVDASATEREKPITEPGPAVPPQRVKNPLLETVRGHAPAKASPDSPTPPPQLTSVPESPPMPSRAAPSTKPPDLSSASGEIVVRAKGRAEPRVAGAIAVPRTEDETQPLQPVKKAASAHASKPSAEPRGAIIGIGMAPIGGASAAGEIPSKVPVGGRVLVPGPNGLMQSATVRQMVSGYYELEIGSSGETIWVPLSGVVPE
jgi:hypothetical protein